MATKLAPCLSCVYGMDIALVNLTTVLSIHVVRRNSGRFRFAARELSKLTARQVQIVSKTPRPSFR